MHTLNFIYLGLGCITMGSLRPEETSAYKLFKILHYKQLGIGKHLKLPTFPHRVLSGIQTTDLGGGRQVCYPLHHQADN